MPAEVLIAPVESDVPPPPVTAEPQIRRLYIKREDVMRHGYSQGCPGCQAIRLGRPAARHSDACRMRIEEAIKRSDPERLQRTDDRINQEIARRVEESDRKRKQEQAATGNEPMSDSVPATLPTSTSSGPGDAAATSPAAQQAPEATGRTTSRVRRETS